MNQSIQIGPYHIGNGLRPIVIAEAGINHNGHLDIALELVRAAKQAGADVIKFQTHIAEAEMLPDKSMSGEAGSHITRSLFDIMKECHLSYEDHLILKKEAEKEGLLFLSTPFSIEAVDLLEKLGVCAYKVGSGEVTNIPFLQYVASKGKPVILSTGTADFDEVGRSVEIIKGINKNLILMQCTSNYPTRYENVNLGIIDKMREAFAVAVGLSDHCQGNYAAFGAVAKGACLIEKHFTLSRHLPGVDQPSSLEPQELKELVSGVKAVYASLGNEKTLNEEAKKVRHGFSESIVTIREIKAGDGFAAHENIWVKRPGAGIPSYELQRVIGKKAACDIPANVLLKTEDVVGF